jgi:hypothetical protein
MKKKQSADEWFAEQLKETSRGVAKVLPQLWTCRATHEMEIGAATMAVSMGIKGLSRTPADRLILLSAKRYAELNRAQKRVWRKETHERIWVFYHGYNLVKAGLKRASSYKRASKRGSAAR